MLILKSDEWSSKACRDKTRVCYITLDITLDKTRVCYITLNITLNKTREDNDKPVLEFSIKSMNIHSVDYIPKDQLKIDYIQSNQPQYFYWSWSKWSWFYHC